MINSSVHLEIPASRQFTPVLDAALSTICERLRWASDDSDDLSFVTLDAFGRLADDESCSVVGLDLRVQENRMQVELASDAALSSPMIDGVQQAAAGRVDRTEVDGSHRKITVTKTAAN